MALIVLLETCLWTLRSILPFILTVIFVWLSNQRKRNFPRGPMGLPLVGYLPFLGKSPPETLQRLSKKHGNIYSMKLGTKDIVILSKYEDIYEAFVKRSVAFSGRHMPSTMEEFGAKNGIIFQPYGDAWKCIRKFGIVTLKGFGVGKRSMEARVNEEIHCLCDVIQSNDGNSFNIQEHLSLSVANVISTIVSGERRDDDQDFIQMLTLLTERFNGKSTARKLSLIEYFPLLKLLPIFKDTYKKFRQHAAFSLGLFQKIVDHHETTFDENDTRDFIDAYIKEVSKAGDGSNLKKSYLTPVIRDLFNAGTETTTTTLRWCFLYLAHNQDVQDSIKKEIDSEIGQNSTISMEVRDRMPLTRSFIHEIQRSRPIIPLINRCTIKDVEIEGYSIPKSTPIIANIWQCHHDPEIFENPGVFNPKRFLNEQGNFEKHERVMPYGIGLRYCLGMHLAEMEVFMFLTGILRSFRLMEDPESPLPSFDDKIIGLVLSPPPYKLKFI